MFTREATLFRTFGLPQYQARYLALLTSARGRAKLTGSLAHARAFDPRYIIDVPRSSDTRQTVYTMLKQRAAPEFCYAISEWAEIDGHELLLPDALRKVIGRGMGTLLACIPDALAYFESEDAGERYILYKPRGSQHG